MDNLMIFGARFIIYLTFLLVFVLSFKGGVRERKSMILAFVSLPTLVIFIKVIHIFFFEPRPFVSFEFDPLIDQEQDASFPSRHTSIMAVIAFTYLYLKSKWAPLFLILMLWVGISRIYVGVHYPVDIIGGFVVGFISILLTKQILGLIKLHFLSQSF